MTRVPTPFRRRVIDTQADSWLNSFCDDDRDIFDTFTDQEIDMQETQEDAAPAATTAPQKPKKEAKPKAKPAKSAAKKAPAKAAKKAKPSPKVDGSAPMKDVLKAHKENYTKTKGEDGKQHFDNGDEVAEALRGADLDSVYSHVAKELGVTAKSLKEKYGHLNPGQQRMNLGNRLRGHMRKAAEE